MTRQGLIRRDTRNEKDDRRSIDDRRNYVLGWDNQQKIDALLEQMVGVQNRLTQATERREKLVVKQSRGLGSAGYVDQVG